MSDGHFSDAVLMGRPAQAWWLRLTGFSMYPRLLPGDELLVERQSACPKFGEVIVFPYRGHLVAHRVIGCSPQVRAAGDASSGQVEHIPYDRILGTVVSVRRSDRAIRAVLRSPSTALVLRVRLALRHYLRIRR